MEVKGLGMSASELCPLSMEDNSDLLTSAEDVDCHLDLADISDDWVSLMMQDPEGLESMRLSTDLAVSHMSCFEVEPDACSGDHEQQEEGSAGSLDFSGHDMLSPEVAGSLWEEMKASGSSAPSSLFVSKGGSGCDTSFQHSSGSLQTGFHPMTRIALNSSPSASPVFCSISFPQGETPSWPSSQSSFTATDGGSSFLVDADGGLDLMLDHDLQLSGSDMSMSSAEVGPEDSCHAAGSSCRFYDVKSWGPVTDPSSLSSSGQADVVVSLPSSLPQVSGSSSSSRECLENEVVQAMLLDHDTVTDGSESDSPTSSMLNISCSTDVHQERTNSVGTSSQQPLLQENGETSSLPEESRDLAAASTFTDGRVSQVFVKGNNITEFNECKTSTCRDLSFVQHYEDSSLVVASRFKCTTEEETSVKKDARKEQLSKGTKRKGDARLMPQQSVSTCSEGQQSDVSDGDKKEFEGEAGDEEDEKRQARLMRNRESAQQSRQRKKVYIDELEHKLRTMTATVAELNATISHLTAENVNLRRQLSYLYQPPPGLGGRPPVMAPQFIPLAPYSGMYGMRPIIPGVPAAPVAIPRLKPQSSVSKPTKKKVSGKVESTEKRKKRKAAGAAVLGLFCFMMLIGPYSWSVPKLERTHHGTWVDHGNVVRAGGRVLNSWGEEDEPEGFWLSLKISRWFRHQSASSSRKEQDCHICCLPSGQKQPTSSSHLVDKQLSQKPEEQNRNSRRPLGVRSSRDLMSSQSLQKTTRDRSPRGAGPRQDRRYEKNQTSRVDSPVVLVGGLLLANASEPFAASLSVPRGNQLVTIQGSLIIQAIMAGDEAAKRDVHSRGKERSKDSPDKVLAEVLGKHMGKQREGAEVAVRGIGQQVQKHVPREALGERPYGAPDKALVRADGGESTANQGAPYGKNIFPALNAGDNFSQYIVNDFTGLGLRAGVCTEIFRFDATPPEVQVGDQSDSKSREASGGLQNETSRSEGRSRRSRRDPFAIPLPPSHARASDMRNESHNQTIPVDDGFKGQEQKSSMVVSVFTSLQETEDGAKAKENFFVVVLVGGVKYVTYSCSLPGKLQPQVVAG